MTRQRKAKLYLVPKAKPNRIVVEQLKGLLDLAKKGELRAFVAVSQLTEAQVMTTFSMSEGDTCLMIGYAERLKHRLHKIMDSESVLTPHEDESS